MKHTRTACTAAALLMGAILLHPTPAHGQTQVTKGIMNGKKYGVTYMLPQTEITLTVTATKHSHEPGRFSRFASRLLRVNDAIQEPSVSWTLDRVEVGIVGKPDKEHVYFVEMKDKTTAPLMELTRDGVVRTINLPFEGDGAATAQAAQALPPAGEKELDPHSFLTEEILMASSSTKMAELVAREIYNIRESKNALLRGEADNMPKDGAQLQIMLDNLNRQEAALTQMFRGKSTTEQQVTTLTIAPEEMDGKVVFRFSEKRGVLDSDDLSGEPVTMSIANLTQTDEPQETAENAKSGKPAAGAKAKNELEGLAYRVPGKGRVEISYKHQSLYNKELPLTQFGTLEYLAAQLFNKNTVTRVRFDTRTGALLKIERANGN